MAHSPHLSSQRKGASAPYWLYLFAIALFLYFSTYLYPLEATDWEAKHFVWYTRYLSLFSTEGLMSVALYMVLWDTLVRWKYWGWLVWLPFAAYQGCCLYMYHELGISGLNAHLGSILATDWAEASTFFTWRNVLGAALALLLNYALYRLGRALLPGVPGRGGRVCLALELVLLASLPLVVLFAGGCGAPAFTRYHTAGWLAQSILRHGGNELVELRNLPSAAEGESSRTPSAQPLTLIYVLGESVRYDHLQLYGYQRPTTPLLCQRHAGGELLHYRALSYDTSTIKSAQGMFTNTDNTSRRATVGSFISLFRKHGVPTAFVSSMSRGGTPTLMLLTEECDEIVSMDSFGVEEVLDTLRSRFANPRKDQIVIVQTKGSHFHYNNKYPHDRFSAFTPDENYHDMTVENVDLVNAYDNTIVYLDYFLNEIMEMFKDSPAVLVYCSDHGESLGEEGRFMHESPLTAMEQRRVPLMIWGSEPYRRLHAGTWQALRSHVEEEVEHGHLFHTLLSLGGIDSVWKRKEMDLTQPAEPASEAEAPLPE